jgi:hypothetical protein
MPRIAFTDLTLSRLKPTKLYITYWDRALPSFGVRVGLHSKTFVLLRGGERKRTSLGKYPATSLKTARSKAHHHRQPAMVEALSSRAPKIV